MSPFEWDNSFRYNDLIFCMTDKSTTTVTNALLELEGKEDSLSPKRTYHTQRQTHRLGQTSFDEDQETHGRKLRKRHQSFVQQLISNSFRVHSQTSNQKNHSSKGKRTTSFHQSQIKRQDEATPSSQTFLLTTEQQQSSIPMSNFSSKNGSETGISINRSEQKISDLNSDGPQILSQEQAQDQIEETQIQSSEESLSFIAFQKTQNQLKIQQIKQLESIKSYSPLNQFQILPWMNSQIKSIEDPLIRLHEEIRSFYYFIRPSRKQHQIRMDIFAHIKKVIKGLYPQSEVLPFGSFATKLYIPDGDIDIVAMIESQNSGRIKMKQFYKNIYHEFKKNHRSQYLYITYISAASVPLVKMYHRQTGFSIDISLNQSSGIHQIEQVKIMEKCYPEFKFLVFVLKVFLKIRHLNQTFSGGIGSFLLICLIYHYLREFHKRTKQGEVANYSLGELLLGFFSFYFMNVDFFKQTIHVKSGVTTPRPRRFNTISMLSPLDEGVDIGMKAWKMKDILFLFKNRHKLIREKHFEEGESILKELINPAMEQFEYFQQKQRFKSESRNRESQTESSEKLQEENELRNKQDEKLKETEIKKDNKQNTQKRKLYVINRLRTINIPNKKPSKNLTRDQGDEGSDSVSY